MPLDFVVKKASNSRPAFSVEIPTPQSVTLTCTLLCVFLAGLDHQLARAIRDRLHGFNTIHHQVDNHLLQMDPISHDRGQGRGQLQLQRHQVAG